MTAVLTTVGATLMAQRFAANTSVPIDSVRVGSLAPAMRYDATPSPTGTRLQGLLDHTPRVLPTANITLLSDMGNVQIDVSDEDLAQVYDADEIAFMSGTTPVFLVAQASGPYFRKVANAAALFSLNFEIAGMAATSVTVSVPSFVFATQAQAEAGTVGNVMMSPLRTAQAVAELSPTVHHKVATANETWTLPSGGWGEAVVRIRSGGGGGAVRHPNFGTTNDAGGGGGYHEFSIYGSAIPAQMTLTVGAGGARGGANGSDGGDSTVAYGSETVTVTGGGGGRASGAGGPARPNAGRGGYFVAETGFAEHYYQGGDAGAQATSHSVYGGGGGGITRASGGVSLFSGNGGNGGSPGSPNGTDGAIPSGGGGAAHAGGTPGNGARGEIEIILRR